MGRPRKPPPPPSLEEQVAIAADVTAKNLGLVTAWTFEAPIAGPKLFARVFRAARAFVEAQTAGGTLSPRAGDRLTDDSVQALASLHVAIDEVHRAFGRSICTSLAERAGFDMDRHADDCADHSGPVARCPCWRLRAEIALAKAEQKGGGR